MIKIKDLSKEYNSNSVLEKIDLEIEPGKITTLLGQNGCGKSTLLNMMSGYELPTSGSVQYKGESLSSIKFSHTRDICFVHEKLEYFFPFSVLEYVKPLKREFLGGMKSFLEKWLSIEKLILIKTS